MDMTALTRRIAFTCLPGHTPAQGRRLLELAGSVDNFFTMSQGELWQLIGASAPAATDAARARALDTARAESDFITRKGLNALFIDDSDYPRRLLECDDAPLLLYAAGDPAVLDRQHTISIVGTRSATAYGVEFTRQLVRELAESLDSTVIISGLAYGIDVAAHRAALDAGLPTVAVVAHGLNTIYPADHRDIAHRMCHQGGAIITEYSHAAPIHKGNFLARNRIVAGLSDVTIVVESDRRGGALATARLAADYNRQVCAVPGRVTDRYSRGCNDLLARNAASILRDAGDLLTLMNWTARPRAGEQTAFDFSAITPEMQRIIDHLRQHPADTVNDMTAALGIPYPTLSARLTEMEMDDLVQSRPGGTYTVLC